MAEMEEKMRNALLMFIDILYAVVYGLILIQTYSQVIMTAKPLEERANNVLLVIGVFYFLSWDWLHGRRLTLTNPYKGYRRFIQKYLLPFLPMVLRSTHLICRCSFSSTFFSVWLWVLYGREVP